MDQKKIGKFIAELRTEKDLTQTELGEILGVSYKAVSKWENGICLPDASLYDDICKIFKITKDELFAGCRREINYKNKMNYILLILCLILLATCLFIPVLSNNIIGMSIIGIVAIITLAFFTSNIYKLTNISKDDRKIKVIKIFNYLLIIAIPILIISQHIFNIENYNNEIVIILIISLIIASGTFFYKFPYNKYIGLRLPWTVRDESTWKIAHQIVGIISLPISILTFVCALFFDVEICATIGIILWILIPSVISGIHFYKLYCRM